MLRKVPARVGVFHLEALDSQVHIVGEVVVRCFGFQLKLKFDLLHQRVQVIALDFESGGFWSNCSRSLLSCSCNSRAGIGVLPLLIGTAMDRDAGSKVHGLP